MTLLFSMDITIVGEGGILGREALIDYFSHCGMGGRHLCVKSNQCRVLFIYELLKGKKVLVHVQTPGTELLKPCSANGG